MVCLTTLTQCGSWSRDATLGRDKSRLGKSKVFIGGVVYDTTQKDSLTPEKLDTGSYYSWNVIEVDRFHKEEKEYHSWSRTLLSAKEIAEVKMSDTVVHSNYLFFIDDYRVIYLSDDDEKSKKNREDEDFTKIYVNDLGIGGKRQLLKGHYVRLNDDCFSVELQHGKNQLMHLGVKERHAGEP